MAPRLAPQRLRTTPPSQFPESGAAQSSRTSTDYSATIENAEFVNVLVSVAVLTSHEKLALMCVNRLFRNAVLSAHKNRSLTCIISPESVPGLVQGKSNYLAKFVKNISIAEWRVSQTVTQGVADILDFVRLVHILFRRVFNNVTEIRVDTVTGAKAVLVAALEVYRPVWSLVISELQDMHDVRLLNEIAQTPVGVGPDGQPVRLIPDKCNIRIMRASSCVFSLEVESVYVDRLDSIDLTHEGTVTVVCTNDFRSIFSMDDIGEAEDSEDEDGAVYIKTARVLSRMRILDGAGGRVLLPATDGVRVWALLAAARAIIDQSSLTVDIYIPIPDDDVVREIVESGIRFNFFHVDRFVLGHEETHPGVWPWKGILYRDSTKRPIELRDFLYLPMPPPRKPDGTASATIRADGTRFIQCELEIAQRVFNILKNVDWGPQLGAH